MGLFSNFFNQPGSGETPKETMVSSPEVVGVETAKLRETQEIPKVYQEASQQADTLIQENAQFFVENNVEAEAISDGKVREAVQMIWALEHGAAIQIDSENPNLGDEKMEANNPQGNKQIYLPERVEDARKVISDVEQHLKRVIQG